MSSNQRQVLLQQAADWLVTLHYDTPTEAERLAFDAWRNTSPAHDAAWQQAQNVLKIFDKVPGSLSQTAIGGLQKQNDRRRALKLLSMSLLTAPGVWWLIREGNWIRWNADMVTATGERKDAQLPDGSRVVLNTQSAINIAFDRQARRVRLLQGEILITTAKDSADPRPFLVDTAEGVIRALGTRFSVRRFDDADISRVSVFQHAVEISNQSGQKQLISAYQQVDFTAQMIQKPKPVASTATLWEQGMLLAKNMRLGDLIAELARYRKGVLRCDPAIADLRLSGAVSVADTDAALTLIEQTLPVSVHRFSRFWVSFKAKA